MKKLSVLFFALLFCSMSFAQDHAIAKYFSQYQKDKNFTKVSVTSKMFSLFTEIDTDDPDEQAILDAMSKLKGIKAVVNEKAENSETMYYDAIQKISSDGSYEELMSVEDANENVMFMVRENAGVISELLMVIGGNKEFMVMSLYGEIDLSQISKISRALKIKGMEHFGAFNNKGDKKEKRQEKKEN